MFGIGLGILRKAGFPLSFVIALAFAGSLTAQDELVSVVPAIDAHVYAFRENGQSVRNVLSAPSGWAPTWIAPDASNQGYVFGAESLRGDGALMTVSPQGAITFGAYLPGVLPRTIQRSSDGDWLVGQAFRVHRVGNGVLSTLSSHPVLPYGFGCDPETGDWILRGIIGTNHGYYRVNPRTGATSTFWTQPGYQVWEAGSREILADVVSGGIVVTATVQQTQVLLRRTSGSGQTTIWTNRVPNEPVVGVTHASEDSQAAYHIVSMGPWGATRPWIIQVAADGTEIGRNPVNIATASGQNAQLTVSRSRHLSWEMTTPPNGRRMRISVPTRPGATYYAMFSLSGVRPGVPVGNRVLPLVVDPLTITCLRGGIRGVIDRTAGTLDAGGEAQVTVDTNRFGASLRGLRAWGGVVIVDPEAPSGFSHVLGPLVLNITQ